MYFLPSFCIDKYPFECTNMLLMHQDLQLNLQIDVCPRFVQRSRIENGINKPALPILCLSYQYAEAEKSSKFLSIFFFQFNLKVRFFVPFTNRKERILISCRQQVESTLCLNRYFPANEFGNPGRVFIPTSFTIRSCIPILCNKARFGTNMSARVLFQKNKKNSTQKKS